MEMCSVPVQSQNEVRLVVLSRTLSADELSSVIPIGHDRRWDAGSAIGRQGRGTHRYSGWAIGSGPSDEAIDVHLSRVLGRMASIEATLGALVRAGRVDSLSLWVWATSLALELTPEQLRSIAGVGATLKIDVHGGGPPMDGE